MRPWLILHFPGAGPSVALLGDGGQGKTNENKGKGIPAHERVWVTGHLVAVLAFQACHINDETVFYIAL